MMQYSKNGLDLTESFEGLRLESYQDQGGVWTCGYGHTGNDVYPDQSITQKQAEQWLLSDVSETEDCVNNEVSAPLTQNEFDALVDFVFNCGCEAFQNSTMLKLLNQKDYHGAADQFERWDKCKGVVIAGLLRRRIAEGKLFEADS